MVTKSPKKSGVRSRLLKKAVTVSVTGKDSRLTLWTEGR
jgi:hypothetical protein